MQLHATRLNRGDDLRQSITDFVISRNMQSATLISAVGSLSKVKIRMAGATVDKQDTQTHEGNFEIVSLTGTVDCDGDPHIHMSISDKSGKVLGGHVKKGCIVDTTCELVMISSDSVKFTRKTDELTGFDEFVVEEN